MPSSLREVQCGTAAATRPRQAPLRQSSRRLREVTIKEVIQTRRQWLRAALICPASVALWAARNDFWESKDPAAWTSEEKQVLLGRSPWAREAFARMEVDKKRPTPGYGNSGTTSGDMPDMRPGSVPGRARSVPIGEAPPPVPNPDPGHPVQFRVLARWETARPVRLAGGPEVPELTGQFYVIRLRGLPLMPPKQKPGEDSSNPNAALLQAIKEGTRLARKGKPGIPCAHLFTGSGDASTDVLLFFERGSGAITLADKQVTLESRFGPFHFSVKFPLKEMVYNGELAL